MHFHTCISTRRDLLLADLPALRLLRVERELTVLGIFSVPEADALVGALEHRLNPPSGQVGHFCG